MPTVEPVEFRRENHYVPQSYLKRWGGADGRVWAYRLLVPHPNVRLWKHASTKALAYYAHLYTRVAASGLSDDFEKWLDSDFESPAAGVIQKVVRDARLTSQDWSHLIRFLAAQDMRTPARLVEMIKRWSASMPELVEDSLAESVQKLKASKRDKKPLAINDYPHSEYFPCKVTTELIPGQELGILRLETVIGRGLWLFELKHVLTTTVNALLEHHWTILRSPPGMAFLTSDDPVIRLNYRNPTEYDFGGGWGRVGTEIFLPLSPHRLLYTRIGARPPQRGTVITSDIATRLQRFTIEHAHRLVFAATPDSTVAQLRPRVIDPAIFTAERDQWARWHGDQTQAEKKLRG